MQRRQADDIVPHYDVISDFRSRDSRTSQSVNSLTTTVATSTTRASTEHEDGVGAGYYVIVVVLVYGMSIVLLIATHLRRKNAKLLEDQQVGKFLQDFQVYSRSSNYLSVPVGGGDEYKIR